jgi:hypothetical protein
VEKTGAMKSLVNLSFEAPGLLEHLGIELESNSWGLREVPNRSAAISDDFGPGPWHDQYLVIAESVGQLRQHLPLFSAEGVTKSLTIVLTNGAPDFVLERSALAAGKAWIPLMRSGRQNEYSYTVSMPSWTKIHKVMVAVLGLGQRDFSLPLGGARVGIRDARGGRWAAGDPLARLDKGLLSTAEALVVDSVDISLGPGLTPTVSPHCQTIEVAGDFQAELPPVDCGVISPRGFNPFPEKNILRIDPVYGTNRWTMTSPAEPASPSFADLSEAVLASIRNYATVRLTPHLPENAFDYAKLLSQLAVAGVPVETPELSAEVEKLLGPSVSDAIRRFTASSSFDLREQASINCRREALKRFAPLRRWRSMTSGTLGGAVETTSVLLATRRPRLLSRMLEQLGRQTLNDFEVVIGLHGVETLEPGELGAIGDFCGPVRAEYLPKEWSLGQVLNRLSDVSSGDLIAKVDDDDWYSPHHLEDLVLAREYSSASLVGTPVEFTYVESLDITTRRQFPGECFADHVAGGTILISKSDLKELGGWRNTSSAVDRGLIDVVLASGRSVYRTHGHNYLMHRRPSASELAAHTWKASEDVFLRNSVRQWDGFHPPTQFPDNSRIFVEGNRSFEYKSYFTAPN